MSAAERTGLYYTCINSYLTPEEAAYIVDDCDAKVFITTQAKSEVAVATAAMTPKVETFLCVDADADIGPFRPYDAALAEFPATHVDDEQLGAAMLYSSGHDRPAQGHPAPAARGAPQRSAAGDAVHRLQPVPHARGDDLPVAGTDLPLRPAGVGGVRPAPRLDVGDHGALRSGAVPRPRRAAPHHPHAGGADDVQPLAQAAGRGPRAIRRVVAGGGHPRRRAVPGAGEAGDDRLVRPDPRRVLRRHRGATGSRGATASSGWPIPARSGRRSSARC